jgi:hypothetical protein
MTHWGQGKIKQQQAEVIELSLVSGILPNKQTVLSIEVDNNQTIIML